MKSYDVPDPGKLPKPFATGITSTSPGDSRCTCTWAYTGRGEKKWALKFRNGLCPVRHTPEEEEDIGWLLPTPTSREVKGSHGKLRPSAPNRKDSIRNLDLSGVIKLLTDEDPRLFNEREPEECAAEPSLFDSEAL